MNRITILTAVIGMTLFSCGTKTPSSTEQQLKTIDSYTLKTDANSNLKETLTEGALTDIEGFKDIGTFKYYVLFDENTNELYRIKNIEKTDKTTTETFYFDKGKLVKVMSATGNSAKKIYLKNGKVVSSSNISIEEQKLLLDKAKRFKKAF